MLQGAFNLCEMSLMASKAEEEYYPSPEELIPVINIVK